MIGFDWFILILLGISIFSGLKNGLFVELASLISFIAGIYIALKFSYITKNILENHVNMPPHVLMILSLITTMVLVIIGIHLLAKTFTKIADFAHLGWINRFGGAVFSAIKTMLLLGIFLTFIQKVIPTTFFISDESREKSFFYQPIIATTGFVMPALKSWYEDVKKELDTELQSTSTP